MRAYLWGIETNIVCCYHFTLPKLRAYLWGIETVFRFDSSLSCKTEVASLPMRNWNFRRRGYPPNWDSVASLPMRNWNCPKTRLVNTIEKLCCEPTYEELKHLKNSFKELMEFGCEPTYEELKPKYSNSFCFQPFRLRAYLWGIETLQGGFILVVNWMVASLPMRNWNSMLCSYMFFFYSVASLPMRNWNNLFLFQLFKYQP